MAFHFHSLKRSCCFPTKYRFQKKRFFGLFFLAGNSFCTCPSRRSFEMKLVRGKHHQQQQQQQQHYHQQQKQQQHQQQQQQR